MYKNLYTYTHVHNNILACFSVLYHIMRIIQRRTMGLDTGGKLLKMIKPVITYIRQYYCWTANVITYLLWSTKSEKPVSAQLLFTPDVVNLARVSGEMRVVFFFFSFL